VICLSCRTRIRYIFALAWWACDHRIWATDEHIDQATA
jgi:hypothetical protein